LRSRTSGLCLDEAVEARDILEFGICVEEKSRMIGVGKAEGVEVLEVGDKILYALRVEELAEIMFVIRLPVFKD
jgi:hypothetical protein